MDGLDKRRNVRRDTSRLLLSDVRRRLAEHRQQGEDASRLLLNPRFVGPCLAGVFCLVVATVIGVPYLFTMSTALLALPVASYIAGIVILRGCSASREPRAAAMQGDRAAVQVRVRSRGGLSGFVVTDRLPRGVEPEDQQRVVIPDDPDALVQMWIRPRKRGRYTLGPIQISGADPLGMFRLRRRIGGVCELVVYPRPVPVRIATASRGVAESGSGHPSGRFAPRGDFAGVREYREGDEPRRVHWRTTARTGMLAVVEYEDIAAESLTVALDLSRGSDFGRGPVTSLDVAAGVAAYVVRQLLQAGRPVRLMLPGSSEVSTLRLRRAEDVWTALAALADARAASSVTAADLVTLSARHGDVLLITTRSGQDLLRAVREVRLTGVRVGVAMVDSEPFGVPGTVEQARDLRSVGAEVEIVREWTHVKIVGSKQPFPRSTSPISPP